MNLFLSNGIGKALNLKNLSELHVMLSHYAT